MTARPDPRRILLAIDASENSARAIDYVGEVAGACPGFTVSIVHVIEDPPEDFFPRDSERREFLERRRAEAEALLSRAKDRLVERGLPPDRISFFAPVKECSSMAGCILEERAGHDFGTLVVGRRGISKSEEFLFGSISNKIIHHAENCTVWVVE